MTGNLGTLEFAGSGGSRLYCNCNSPSPIYYGNIAPRIGMAYSVDPKTVIRGSYTVNYARGDWTSGKPVGTRRQLPGLTALRHDAAPSHAGVPADLLGRDGLHAMARTRRATAASTECDRNPPDPAPPAAPAWRSTARAKLHCRSRSGGAAYYLDKYKGARTPQYINWTFGIQRQITRDMSLTVSYVGSQGHFVSGGFDPLNRHNALTDNFAAVAGYNLSGGATRRRAPASARARRPRCWRPSNRRRTSRWLRSSGLYASQSRTPAAGLTPPPTGLPGTSTHYPQYSGVSDTTNFNGNTNYHALEMSLRERAAHGVDFMLNYTYSKSIDDVGTFRRDDNASPGPFPLSHGPAAEPDGNGGATVALRQGQDRRGDNFLVRVAGQGTGTSRVSSSITPVRPVAFTASGCAGSPMGSACRTSVAGLNPRTISYNFPPGGIMAAMGYSNTYSAIHHLNLHAFTVDQAPIRRTEPQRAGD